MKQLKFIFVFVFVRVALQSQVLTVQENDPNRARNLSVSVFVFGADVYNPNLNFFVEGGLTYRSKGEKLLVRANYRLAFFDRIESIDEGSSSVGLPANGTQPLRQLEGQFGFNFIRKEQTAVATKRFVSKNRTTQLPVKYLRCYGVHAGYGLFRSIIAQGSTIDYPGEFVNLEGQRSPTVLATPMLNMTTIHLGIHRLIVHDYVIQARENGNLEETVGKTSAFFYADFSFAPSINLDDVLLPLGNDAPNSDPNYSSRNAYNYYAVTINGRKKMPIGGRIGYETTVLKPFGLTVGYEMGFRPGIFDPMFNMYFLAKLGFSINARIK